VKIPLFLLGYGHVARRFAELLRESEASLAALGVEPVIVAVATRRSGLAFDPEGLAPAALEARDRPCDLAAIAGVLRDMQRFPVRVLVETTTLSIEAGEPAISHVRAALASGAHVITANKGPVAFAYRALADEAARAGVSFLFEGAVMDGVPVFGLIRDTMPTVQISGFRGVVNSTTNFILTAMEQGESFESALTRMQQAGVAEADPSLDVDGWDAAAKAAALGNVLLDADATPLTVAREGIGPATATRAAAARERGRRLKLVASGSGRGSSAALRVQLEELDADDPLAILEGQANALELDTWPLGRVVITQRDGGLEKTAYALLADLMTIAHRSNGSMDRSVK
jgi:homoserine dehydrogenase